MRGEKRRPGLTDEWLVKQGAPEESEICMTPNEGMNGKVWRNVINKLAPALRKMSPKLDVTGKHAVLFLDGLDCHSMSIDAPNILREYRIFAIKMPSHTSGNLQPLDVSVFQRKLTSPRASAFSLENSPTWSRISEIY